MKKKNYNDDEEKDTRPKPWRGLLQGIPRNRMGVYAEWVSVS